MWRGRERGHDVEYRNVVHAYWYPRLAKKCGRLREEGKYPFEGEWRTQAEIVRLRRSLRRRDRALVMDIGMVFAVAIGILAMLVFLITLIVQ